MTIKELSQLRALSKEISYLKQRLIKLRHCINKMQSHDYVNGSGSIFPYITHTIKIEGIISYDVRAFKSHKKEIEDVEYLLQKKTDECINQYQILNQYIQNISDSQLRQILSLRYIDGLSWKGVASSIGEGDESYPRRKHNTFLKLAENAEFEVL